MEYKDIISLIKTVKKSDLSEFKMKQGDFELVIRTEKYARSKQEIRQAPQPVVQVPPQPVAPPQSAEAPAHSAGPAPQQAPAEKGGKEAPKEAGAESGALEDEGLVPVKSPIVGTFYRASAPDKPPYVKVGDEIKEGSVVCIVEAMKLFNEIESEVSGKIVKVMVEDASPVEYDQVLFLVDPS